MKIDREKEPPMLKVSWSLRHQRSRTSWDDLIKEVLAKATMPDSSLHGEVHWRAVISCGMQIAKGTAADHAVVFAFGLIHDSQRLDDGYDLAHGARAAASLDALRTLPGLLTSEQLSLLARACEDHENGLVSEDPTIGCCWDADRINLWRVGVAPDPHFFSILEEGPAFDEISEGARSGYREPPSWADLVEKINRGYG
ncbi:hypothetical protein KUV57_13540 [Epibacterium sp. DP7N7-1]|nr:hypothetical protein [Epibacterium sp. DP7N7-1]